MSLDGFARKYGTDKADHGYCPHYDRHLMDLCDQSIELLEVGVHDGGSLRMWRDWFPWAHITGIDKNPATMITGETRIDTICDDASTPRPWRKSEPEWFDVIIDDGSHLSEEVVGAWRWTWPLLKPGGWYVVEDLGAQFCIEFGARVEGLDEGSSATDMLDALAHRAMRGGDVSEFHVYREIVFVRKAGP